MFSRTTSGQTLFLADIKSIHNSLSRHSLWHDQRQHSSKLSQR